MTTASRVSDSRVTDGMVNHARRAAMTYRPTPEPIEGPQVSISFGQMRAALEATLACKGPVVTVSDLEALREEIRAQASLKDHYAEWEETERMFSALIAKANGHE